MAGVDENVFAYSNRSGDQRRLVLYNNRYSSVRGRIDMSAVYADKGSGEQRQQRLRDSLECTGEAGVVLAYRDSLTGLEFLRRSAEVAERGLAMELQGYECHVLLDWRELRSTGEQRWELLCDVLGGRGVPNLQEALVGLELRPTHDALRSLLQPALMKGLAELARAVEVGLEEAATAAEFHSKAELFAVVEQRSGEFFTRARGGFASVGGRSGETVAEAAEVDLGVAERLEAALRIPSLRKQLSGGWPLAACAVLPCSGVAASDAGRWGPIVGWLVLRTLAESLEDVPAAGVDLFDRLRLRQPVAEAFGALGLEGEESWRAAARVRVLLLAEAGDSVSRVER